MRGERGQITLFFIVGLVILLILGVLYLVISSTRTDKDVTDQGQRALDTASSALISSQIGACIDTIVNDELRLLGESGSLPPEDGFPSGLVGTGRTQRPMLYGVTLNRDTLALGGLKPYMLDIPAYPDPRITISSSIRDPESNDEFAGFIDGYFGDVNFPPVCDHDGPNKRGTTRACRYYPGSPPSTPFVKSTQERLRASILQRVQTCASLRGFEDTLGIELESVSAPSADVVFTQTGTVVTLKYPITVKGQTESVLEEFRKVYPVRYLPIAQFAVDLARAESRDVNFHLMRDYREIQSYSSGFTVLKNEVTVIPNFGSENPPLDERASLVTIIDGRSEIDGVSYSFSFLMERRPPMLDKMREIISCIAIDEIPLPELIAEGRIRGADPDDGTVEFTWCRDDPGLLVPCPGNITLVAFDEDGMIDYEITACIPL